MRINDFLVKQAAARAGKPCGCEQGGYGLLLGVGILAVYWVTRGQMTAPSQTEIYFGLGFVFITATIGKFVGIHLEKRTLASEAAKTLAKLDMRPIEGEALQKFWRAQPRPCCGRG